MKWKKVTKITHQYVPWQCVYSPINVTYNCPCPHHDGIWDRGGTNPHITNPVLLHTVPSDNILATTCSVNLPFFHISLAIKTGDSFTHYISWNPYFHGLLVFSITYPHSLTLHLHYPWGKCRMPTEQGAGWAIDLAWKPWRSEKSLDPERNLTSFTH